MTRYLALALFCAATAGCHASQPGYKSVQATDEWSRRYDLSPGGEVQIVGADGTIEVTGTDGAAVEVRAERIARASSDAAARELLPRIQIREEVAPDKILMETEGLSGLVIGVDVAVNYHVLVPAASRLQLRSTGAINVSGITGRTVVTARAGGVTMKGMSGGLDVRATNGAVDVELTRVGADPIEIRATNGNLALTIPRDTNAYLLANFTNGKIDTGGMAYEPVGEQTRRRIRGRLNAGGTPIELTSTNGNIQLHSQP